MQNRTEDFTNVIANLENASHPISRERFELLFREALFMNRPDLMQALLKHHIDHASEEYSAHPGAAAEEGNMLSAVSTLLIHPFSRLTAQTYEAGLSYVLRHLKDEELKPFYRNVRPQLKEDVLERLFYSSIRTRNKQTMKFFIANYKEITKNKELERAFKNSCFNPDKGVFEFLVDSVFNRNNSFEMSETLEFARKVNDVDIVKSTLPNLVQQRPDAEPNGSFLFAFFYGWNEMLDYLMENYKSKIEDRVIQMVLSFAERKGHGTTSAILSNGSLFEAIRRELSAKEELIFASDAPHSKEGSNNSIGPSLKRIEEYVKGCSFEEKCMIWEALKTGQTNPLLKEMAQIAHSGRVIGLKKVGEDKSDMPENLTELILAKAYPRVLNIPFRIARDVFEVKKSERFPQKGRE